jgi:nucleoside-diphosphate-sugar epimerase
MTIAIFGAAGATGQALAEALGQRGLPFRVVGRSREKLQKIFGTAPTIEVVDADLSTLEGAKKASRGASAVVYAVGPADYSDKEFAKLPGWMSTALEAAVAEGVKKFILLSTVYSYGAPVPTTSKVSENHPRQPVAYKGEMRKQQEDLVLAAHGRGGLSTLVLRLPDFYGPKADTGIFRGLFDAAVAGKPADLFAPVDKQHEFLYVPDLGPVVAELLARDDVYGEAYNLAGPSAITTRDFAAAIYQAAGRPLKFRAAGKFMVRILGLFIPFMRDFYPMLYLQDTPILLDDSKLQSKIGPITKTSYEEGIRNTIAAMKARAAA